MYRLADLGLWFVQVFIPSAITKNWEIWRLVTGFGFGGSGIGLLFDTFLLYRNSVDLEERHFQGRTASYSKLAKGDVGADELRGGPSRKLIPLHLRLTQPGPLF